jgi:hypothetical protein
LMYFMICLTVWVTPTLGNNNIISYNDLP